MELLTVLLQATPPTTLPTEFGQPLLIAFGAAVALAYHRSQEARVKRAEQQVDTLTGALPELLLLLREWKEVSGVRKNGPQGG